MTRTTYEAAEQQVIDVPQTGWQVRSHPGDGQVSVLAGGDCFQLLDANGEVQWTLWRAER